MPFPFVCEFGVTNVLAVALIFCRSGLIWHFIVANVSGSMAFNPTRQARYLPMNAPDFAKRYSYRTDPAVPDFDDSGPVTVMDGECALCSVGARLIARFDKATEFRICRTQTPLGQALYDHYGLSRNDPESWLYIVDGRAYTSIDAVIRVGRRLGGAGYLLQPLRLMPEFLQNWLYRRIARNRYRLFGRTNLCDIPDLALRARLMD